MPVLEWARQQAEPRGKLSLLCGLADDLAERFASETKASRPAGP